MSNAIPPVLVQLVADVSQLKTGLAQAENALKNLNKSVESTSSGMNNFMNRMKQVGASVGIAFAGTQVLQFGKDVIAQAAEAEGQQQRLAQIMKVATGASDEQIASLNAQAEALEKVGVITGGNITQTQSQLATFNLQTDTIKALTPAILDYVTAEKGANASADEFKQMTNGLAQALNGNFGSLTRVGFVLDENTKKQISSGTEAQRAAAIVGVLNSTYEGFNEELRNTPEGQMQALANDFNKLKEDLGKALLPTFQKFMKYLTGTVLPGIRSLGKFIKDNQTIIAVLTGGILAGIVAWKAYMAVQKLVAASSTILKVAQTVLTGGQLASIASTNTLAASMLRLNAVMRANPIGLIVTAIALVAAGFVIAWKKSETFRGIVIAGVQLILNWWAFLIEGVGKLIGLFAKLPGQGWAKGLAKGAQDAADSIRKTSKGLSDLKTNAKITTTEDGTPRTPKLAGDPIDKDALKAAEKAAKEKLKIQEKAVKDLKDLKERFAEIEKNYDEDISEAHKRELKSRLEAQKRFNDRMKELNDSFAKEQDKIEKNHSDRLLKIDEDYAESVLQIKENFAEKMEQIQSDNTKAVEDITSSHFQKIADIQATYAEKLQAIVEKSIARLTDAFASATKTDVGKLFSDLEKSGDTSGEALVAKMKQHLTSIKKLAENASALAGAGFSQTFIEQVMAMGPDAGNKMAEALLKGSPETNKEMQDLFGELENVSNNGVTDLAKSMSKGGKLATQALMEEYKKTQRDLSEALAKQNNSYQQALADQARKFKEAVDKTNADLAKALEDASKKLKEQILEENDAYTKTLAEAQESYDEAIAQAAKTRDEAFADAQEQLVEDIAKAEKTMLDALTKLRKAFEDKLKPVKDLVSGIGAEIGGLGGKIEDLLARLAAAQTAYNNRAAQNAEGILGSGTKPPASSPDEARNGNTNNYNLSIKTETNATAASIENAAMGALKFGLPLGIN